MTHQNATSWQPVESNPLLIDIEWLQCIAICLHLQIKQLFTILGQSVWDWRQAAVSQCGATTGLRQVAFLSIDSLLPFLTSSWHDFFIVFQAPNIKND